MSDERYYTAEVSQSGVPYIFITNGWGPDTASTRTPGWERRSWFRT